MRREESAWWSAGFTAEWWEEQSDEQRAAFLAELSPQQIEDFERDWRVWGRDSQLMPEGIWDTWLLLMGRGSGKALALDTPIPTPDGWTTMGEIQTGDRVFDETGSICRVVKAHSVLLNRECFTVRFSDGSEIVADAEHLWLTECRRSRKAAGRRRPGTGTKGRLPQVWPAIRTTKQIAETLIDEGERNHAVPVTQPLKLPDATLPIDPYLLGAWLGDGSSAAGEITTADHEIVEQFIRMGEPIAKSRPAGGKSNVYPITNGYVGSVEGRKKTFCGRLRALGVLKNKHIPAAYLRASSEQRLALLQGLMDTDGYAGGSRAEFSTSRSVLAEGVFELIASLGMIPTIAKGTAYLYGKDCGPKYRVTFRPRLDVFRLERKIAGVKPLGSQARRTSRRFIVAVEPTDTVPVRCITVDSKSNLYLAGRGMIPTHNTRSAVEACNDQVKAGKATRLAIVGQGDEDIRRVMIEGESGFLATAPSGFRPTFYPSRGGGILEWPNGATGFVYSAQDTEGLRGPEFDLGWFDEPMAVPADFRQRAMDNLEFCLRLPPHPRLIITTTPKPHRWLHEQLAEAKKDEDLPIEQRSYIVSRGTTLENRKNLAASFVKKILKRYDGTNIGKQEIYAEVLGEEAGAVWTPSMLDKMRIRPPVEWSPDEQSAYREAARGFAARGMTKVVIGVDPNAKTASNHAAGIVPVALRGDGIRFCLGDWSAKNMSPIEWAKVAVRCYEYFDADEIVAEVNNGGEMVRDLVRQAAKDLGVDPPNFHMEHAKRDKLTRATPIASLYETHRAAQFGSVGHKDKPGPLYLLEQQMCALHEAFDTTGEDFDRADALVWGMKRLGRDADDNEEGGGTMLSFEQAMGTT